MGFVFVFTAIAVIAFFLILLQSTSRKRLLHRCTAACQQLAASGVHTSDIDAALIKLLRFVGTITEAPAYAIYLYDGKKEEYTMRVVRYQEQEHKNLLPSYSGLSPYSKGICCMPATIAPESVGSSMELLQHERGDLLLMPLPEAGGILAIGPLVSVGKKDLNCLCRLQPDIQSAIAAIRRIDNKGYA